MHVHQKIVDSEARVCKLNQHLDDLRIVYDYHSWHKVKNDTRKKILRTKSLFAFDAWMSVREYSKFKQWIQNIFVGEVSVEKTDIKKGEEVPIQVKNMPIISSFEPVVEMFGLPVKKDLDPTVFVAPFFFIFFGLMLSDVGYGLILATFSAWLLFFGKFSRTAKEGILLLFLCGVGAFLGGIMVG